MGFILKRDVPFLKCIFFTQNWLTLTPKTQFVQVFLKVALIFSPWQKYVILGWG